MSNPRPADLELFAAIEDGGAHDPRGQTPALFAALHGHADCLGLLIHAGCDIEAIHSEGETP